MFRNFFMLNRLTPKATIQVINPTVSRFNTKATAQVINPTVSRFTTKATAQLSKPMSRPDSEWRASLSPAQFHVLREKGTEPPGSGEYNKFYPSSGTFACAGCNTPLYRAATKFDSGCGWPAFYEALPGAIELHEDRSGGRVRTEMVCGTCQGHLGHVFRGEGFKTPTDERHCVNSVAIKFVE